jgi:hypothetical protein
MTTFDAHWNQLLGAAADPGDIIGSIREEAINHYFEKHHQLDNSRYSVTKTIVAKVDEGGTLRDVPVTLTVRATTPVIVNFAPFAGVGGAAVGGQWTDLAAPPPEPALNASNVQLRVERVQLSLSWQSVFSPGTTYSWQPSPILFEAEAYVRLTTINDPENESRHALNLQLMRARFDRPARAVLERELQELIARLPVADQAIVQKHAVDKFDELLVIALNTAALELAPRFAASLEIPVPVIAKKHLIPRNLLVSENIVSVSFGLAENQLRRSAEEALRRAMAEVRFALDQDIEEAGGLRELVVANGDSVDWDDLDSVKNVEILSEEEIAAKLVHLNQVVGRQEKRLKNQMAVPAPAGPPAIRDGVAVALNERLLDAIAATFTRTAPDECTNWLDLGAVRGRACYWARIFDADVKIGEASGQLRVGGAVAVDVGGSIEACVRKFWDCSWKWACSQLRLAVRGRPGIELSLAHSNFIAFSARITGRLSLESNLPFPFDKVISAVSGIIWEAIKAVLNAFISQIQIVLVPPKLEVPKQRTAIALSGFTPHYYPFNGGTTPQQRFAAFQVGITAG